MLLSAGLIGAAPVPGCRAFCDTRPASCRSTSLCSPPSSSQNTGNWPGQSGLVQDFQGADGPLLWTPTLLKAMRRLAMSSGTHLTSPGLCRAFAACSDRGAWEDVFFTEDLTECVGGSRGGSSWRAWSAKGSWEDASSRKLEWPRLRGGGSWRVHCCGDLTMRGVMSEKSTENRCAH